MGNESKYTQFSVLFSLTHLRVVNPMDGSMRTMKSRKKNTFRMIHRFSTDLRK